MIKLGDVKASHELSVNPESYKEISELIGKLDAADFATDESGEPIQVGVGVFDRHIEYSERTPLDNSELTRMLLTEFTRMKGELKGLDPEAIEQAEVTDETIEQLKSLGYLQ